MHTWRITAYFPVEFGIYFSVFIVSRNGFTPISIKTYPYLWLCVEKIRINLLIEINACSSYNILGLRNNVFYIDLLFFCIFLSNPALFKALYRNELNVYLILQSLLLETVND